VPRLVALVVALGLGVGALGCAPLYGGKAEPLSKLKKKKAPPESEVAIPWDEECKVDFFGDGAKFRPRPQDAAPLFESGQAAMTQADRSPDPAAKGVLIVDALNKFKNALTKDPYNAEITLALAAGYARALKKGCALALLKRLVELEGHPDYESAARRMIGSAQSEGAFGGFRKESDAAVGH